MTIRHQEEGDMIATAMMKDRLAECQQQQAAAVAAAVVAALEDKAMLQRAEAAMMTMTKMLQ